MPRLKIMETEVLNAFASGMTESQYAVTVTRGLA
jgi:heat shock protein HtpX